MSIAEIREQLHQYIDVANDSDVAAIFSFIEDKAHKPHSYTEAELNEFYKRREQFNKGGNKGYSVEDVHASIRNGETNL